MSVNKKYYYLRLHENYFESNEQIYLESLPEGYAYSNILMKLYLLSLKRDGLLLFNDRVPYNAQTLATVIHHPVKRVKMALALFQELGIIQVQENGAIFMLDVQSFVGKTSTENERKRKYRERIKRGAADEPEQDEDGTNSGTNAGQTAPDARDKRPPEIEKKTDTEKEIKITTETERKTETDARATPPAGAVSVLERISSAWNGSGLEPFPEALPQQTHQALCRLLVRYGVDAVLQAVAKAQQSSFLREGSKTGWKATFDWFVQEENFLKVWHGTYDAFS